MEQILQRQNIGRIAGLMLGDVLAIFLFVWVGRASHNLTVFDFVQDVWTALPFLLGWFAVAPWFGLFGAGASQNWRRTGGLVLAAWAIAGPLSLGLRVLFLGRGFAWTFVAVSLAVIGVTLLLWRLAYGWWLGRGTA